MSIDFLDKTNVIRMPYIIAEMNTSHNGDVAHAKKMIDKAKQIGCNAVKFQSWSTDSLYSRDYYKKNPIAKRMVGKLALSEEALYELSEYSRKCNIDFSSTPYSEREVDFLVEKCKVPFIKVASMDLNNYRFLQYIAKKNVPMILSTGMGTEKEIKQAVKTITDAGNEDICLLHCVSVYPVEASQVSLRYMFTLKKLFPHIAVGYSDHTIGEAVPIAATALGAAVIEKHFTLDSSKIGWDNQMAMEPEQFKQMILGCRAAFSALGSEEKVISEEEQRQRESMRRSIVAARDIEQGAIIGESDIDGKRPGTGIPVDRWQQVIGKKAVRNICKDEMIAMSDLC